MIVNGPEIMQPNRSQVESVTLGDFSSVVISSGAVETPGEVILGHDRDGIPGPMSGNVLTSSDAAFVKRINRALFTSTTLSTNNGLIADNLNRAMSKLSTRGHAGNGRRSEQNRSGLCTSHPGTAS